MASAAATSSQPAKQRVVYYENAVFFADGSNVFACSAETGKLLQSYTGQLETVDALAVRYGSVYTASRDKIARIYHLRSGRLKCSMQGHSDWITGLLVDSERVYTCSDDKTACAWNAFDGSLLMTFTGHQDRVVCMMLSGGFLFTGSMDCVSRQFDATTGKLVREFPGHTNSIRSLALGDGKLFSGSADHTARAFDLASGAAGHVFSGHTNMVECMEYSRGSLFTGSTDQTARRWDTASGECVKTFEGHDMQINALIVRDDTLYTAGNDDSVRSWNIDSGETVHEFDGHSGSVQSLYLHGKHLCSVQADVLFGSEDGVAILWDADTGEGKQTLLVKRTIFKAIAVDPETNSLFTAYDEADEITKLDLATGDELGKLEGHEDAVRCLTMYNHHLFSGSSDNTIRMWDTGPCNSLRTFSSARAAQQVLCIQVANDVLYSGSWRTVHAWNIKTGEILRVFNGLSDWVNALHVYQGVVYAGGDDRSICAWDASTTKLLHRFTGTKGRVISLRVNKGVLYTASRDRYSGPRDQPITAWNVVTGEVIKHYEGHTKHLNAIEVIDSHLWSGSDDGNVRVYDVTSGNLLRTHRDHKDSVEALTQQAGIVYSSSSDVFAYHARVLQRVHVERKHHLLVEDRTQHRLAAIMPWLDFAWSVLLVLLLPAVQLLSLGIGDGRDWRAQPLGSALFALRTFGLLDVSVAAGVILLYLMVLVFVLLLGTKEQLDLAVFTQPRNHRLTYVQIAYRLAIKLLVFPLLIPVLSFTAGVTRCTADAMTWAPGIACTSPAHVGVLVAAYVAALVYLALVLRIYAVGGEVDNIKGSWNVFRRQRDRFWLSHAHPLTLGHGGRSYFASILPATVLAVFLATWISPAPGIGNAIGFSANRLAGFALVLLAMRVYAVAVAVKTPAFYTDWGNEMLAATDAVLIWTYACAIAAPLSQSATLTVVWALGLVAAAVLGYKLRAIIDRVVRTYAAGALLAAVPKRDLYTAMMSYANTMPLHDGNRALLAMLRLIRVVEGPAVNTNVEPAQLAPDLMAFMTNVSVAEGAARVHVAHQMLLQAPGIDIPAVLGFARSCDLDTAMVRIKMIRKLRDILPSVQTPHLLHFIQAFPASDANMRLGFVFSLRTIAAPDEIPYLLPFASDVPLGPNGAEAALRLDAIRQLHAAEPGIHMYDKVHFGLMVDVRADVPSQLRAVVAVKALAPATPVEEILAFAHEVNNADELERRISIAQRLRTEAPPGVNVSANALLRYAQRVEVSRDPDRLAAVWREVFDLAPTARPSDVLELMLAAQHTSVPMIATLLEDLGDDDKDEHAVLIEQLDPTVLRAMLVRLKANVDAAHVTDPSAYLQELSLLTPLLDTAWRVASSMGSRPTSPSERSTRSRSSRSSRRSSKSHGSSRKAPPRILRDLPAMLGRTRSPSMPRVPPPSGKAHRRRTSDTVVSVGSSVVSSEFAHSLGQDAALGGGDLVPRRAPSIDRVGDQPMYGTGEVAHPGARKPGSVPPHLQVPSVPGDSP